MNAVGFVIGCILIAVALVMLANRAGYVYFVIGPATVLAVAFVVAMLAVGFWLASQ
jgi:hypothetical protein